MARKKSTPDEINEKLHEAIDGLRKDVTRVEIWATALSTFAQPIPDFQPDPKYQLGHAGKTENLAENDNAEPAGTSRGNTSENTSD
jgi:hypothetical protein